ncbi:protein-glutamate methylesterase/protein-glutamine glutaminase [Virgibacillus oceani]|uniref:Protein-glutamate methylesterase/protein-glutamine glutaminase n=1 Tax=Virgibacillus oceani TaxID=1479511 RepID=A0A917H6B1_9BACI|nr:chemotaxis response regulator protein-glutamate methylesterase [Virgibacillus oceani]GGG68879.1 chemotaxis response regulator protein-glutamate methylesterase [Virgibacillus oceani]
MNPIRVLVIDDSAFMRKMIQDILSSDKRLEIVGTARNGEDGIKKIHELSPDVVTLDVEMPKMDGITALQKIMETNPLPVVMLSSVTIEGARKTVQAISNGAVDFISKPSGPISLDITTIKQEIISKVIAASQAKLPKKKQEQPHYAKGNLEAVSYSRKHAKSIVTIGTSTGGPRALQRVLTDLPGDFMPPIVIVQHMPAGFTKSLADRLNTLTGIHIKEAVHGEIIQQNTAYIAPGNYHMRIHRFGTALVIDLTQDAAYNGHRPAVDVLFKSVAQLNNINKIAVLLTGMGSDGSEGIKKLKEEDPNAYVIAESEETSVVYGMPKAALKTNCVNQVIHLHQVGETITHLIKK